MLRVQAQCTKQQKLMDDFALGSPIVDLHISVDYIGNIQVINQIILLYISIEPDSCYKQNGCLGLMVNTLMVTNELHIHACITHLCCALKIVVYMWSKLMFPSERLY